ncbi:MAG: GFA family protein [Parvibaculaceae bacterium]
MCGSVRWSYSGETTRNLVCHCSDCQRATSSPFTAFLGMRPSQIRWTGKIEHYESSTGTYRGFCPSCGTRLYFRSEKWPDEIHIHAATLTHPNDYRPDAQVVMRSRAGWLDRLDAIPGYRHFHMDPSAPQATLTPSKTRP